MPDLGVRADNVTSFLLPAVLLDLQHLHAPRRGSVEALAAQTRVQLPLIGRRYQQALRGLGRLEVPGRAAGVGGAAAGSSLHRAGRRFRPAVRSFVGPLGAVRLRGGRVEVAIAEAIATEGLGGQIVPRLRLGVLKARRWSLVHAGVPVKSVGAQTGGARSNAVSSGGHVAAGDGVQAVAGSARAVVRSVLLLRLLGLLPLHVVMLCLLLLLRLVLALLVPGPPLLLPAPATGHAVRVAARARQVVRVQTSAVGLFPAPIRARDAGYAETVLRGRVQRLVPAGVLLLARFVRLRLRRGAGHPVRLVVAVPRRSGHPRLARHLREEVVVVASGPRGAHCYQAGRVPGYQTWPTVGEHVVEQQMLRGCGWSTALDRRRVEAGRWRRLIGVTRDHAVRRSLASRQGMSFPSTHQDGSFPLAEPLQLAEPRLESALQLDVTHMQFHLPNTVFEGHDHPHPGITVLYEINQRLVIGPVHFVAVYGKYHVTLPHASLERRPVVLNVVHVRDHLDFLLPLVVYTIALQRETVRAVLLLDDDSATPSVLIRSRHPI